MEPGFQPLDMHRIFFGDYPPLYFAEVAFRVAVIYAWTLLLIRWIGGRGVSQLSMVELLLVIALGSAVGDAMFYDDVPLLVAMWVITLVVVVNKALDKLIARSSVAETVIDGQPIPLVQNGEIVAESLARRDLGTDEVKAIMRQAGVSNLGQVEHAYLEINGAASIFRLEQPRPGLAIVPPRHLQPLPPLRDPDEAQKGLACCANCGHVSPALAVLPDVACANCGGTDWTAPAFPAEPDSLAAS